MNEKYLWDKTGEDAEIEKLEQTLQTFRHRQHVPPALPAKVIPFEPRRRRSFFQFATAFTACSILITLGLSLWLKTAEPDSSEAFVAGQINSKPDQKIASEPVQLAVPTFPAAATANPPVVKAKAPAGKNFASAYALARNPVKKSELLRPHNLTATAITPDIIEPEKKPVRLTREEKFAYNQLMLALSITSSKLKIVKNTAEGDHQPKKTFSDRE